MSTVVRAATVETAADPAGGDALVLRARLVPWGEAARVTDDGRTFYTETWEAGSLVLDPTAVAGAYRGHVPSPVGPQRGPLVGRVAELEHRDDGAHVTVRLADIPAAREVHALADVVGASVSLEADLDPSDPAPRPDMTVTRRATHPATLTGLAILTLPDRGAFPGSVVTATRTHQETPMTTMTDTPDTPTPEVPEPPDPGGPDDPRVPSVSRAEINEMIRQASARAFVPGRALAHPLAAWPTLVSYTDDVFKDPTIARALQDQITTDNPGVVPPAWVSDVKGIVTATRPAIEGTGGPQPLPPGGMELTWPAFRGNLTDLINAQMVEKTEITSVKVSLLKETADLTTWAGGSDISYQLIRRSSPSYRDAYMRIMNAAYAATTENVFEDALLAGAGGTVVLAPTADVDAFRAFVFEASVEVESATGAPATLVLLASDLFIKFGAALFPGQYSPSNVSGTADAASLNVNISGLQVRHGRFLAAGQAVVTNGIAARFVEDGPMAISAPDVPRLGENVAVWGMGVAAIYSPLGVIKNVAAAGTTGTATAATAKK